MQSPEERFVVVSWRVRKGGRDQEETPLSSLRTREVQMAGGGEEEEEEEAMLCDGGGRAERGRVSVR